MTQSTVFALPPHRSAKDRAELVEADRAHFEAMSVALAVALADLTEQLAAMRAVLARAGQELLERDLQVHRLGARLRLLRRYSLDLCLGRMTPLDGSPPVYIGRIGVKDRDGTPLLVDWRTPAAEPFFAATLAHPQGLASRRRYRWSGGQIVDYWDETLTPGAPGPATAPDEDSGLLSSLAQARTPRMRDVLSTIAADQDAIIRTDTLRPLLVDGGPGTGKTVVALHRAAYLAYADPRLGRTGANLLVLGPHQPYLTYIADVLPSLGEDSVHTATLADLVHESATAVGEPDPRVAALKHSWTLVEAIEPAVGLYEEPPTTTLDVDTAWGPVRLTRHDWADAFAAIAPGTPHNEARAEIWDELAEIAASRLAEADGDPPGTDDVRGALERDENVADALGRAWPLLDPTDLVADLWEVPAYLRRCAPSLTSEDRALLRRPDPRAWTDADLPLLDAARHRLGDPRIEQRRRRQRAERAAVAREMDDVVAQLTATDDSEMQVMSMLRGADLRDALATDSSGGGDETDGSGPAGADPVADTHRLAGPFAHVVIDEAQELTDAQWAMVLRRCPTRSLTIVGDRAQARHGFTEGWAERLARVGLDRLRHATLTLNYRTPAEVMAEAEPVIRAALPDANVPTSIRQGGIPVRRARVGELAVVVEEWLADHAEGTVGVIAPATVDLGVRASERVALHTPLTAKGLEFDLVVLTGLGDLPGITGAVDRYVAMTRTTGTLIVLDGS